MLNKDKIIQDAGVLLQKLFRRTFRLEFHEQKMLTLNRRYYSDPQSVRVVTENLLIYTNFIAFSGSVWEIWIYSSHSYY